jgi:hypothetical protein
LGIAVNEITSTHDAVKKLRARQWAEANQTNPNKYNLFLAERKNPTAQIDDTKKATRRMFQGWYELAKTEEY